MLDFGQLASIARKLGSEPAPCGLGSDPKLLPLFVVLRGAGGADTGGSYASLFEIAADVCPTRTSEHDEQR